MERASPSHQTGWTGIIARFIQMGGLLDADGVLRLGRHASAVSGAGTVKAKRVVGAA
jgi:hypothetical protein